MTTESIRVTGVLPARPEHIYEAWLDGVKHSAMTGGGAATVDPRPGGRHTAWDGYIEGETIALEPARRIVQTWRSSEFPADADHSRLEVLLEEVDGGTRITFVHTEIPAGQGSSYEKVWREFYLEPMARYFSVNGAVAMTDDAIEDDDEDEDVELASAAEADEADEDDGVVLAIERETIAREPEPSEPVRAQADEGDEEEPEEAPRPARRAPAKKPAKKRPAKKATKKPAKKGAAKKAAKKPAKKRAAKKAAKKPAKKGAAKKSAAKKTAKKSAAKKASAKKTSAKKAPAKRGAKKGAKAAGKKRPAKRR